MFQRKFLLNETSIKYFHEYLPASVLSNSISALYFNKIALVIKVFIIEYKSVKIKEVMSLSHF